MKKSLFYFGLLCTILVVASCSSTKKYTESARSDALPSQPETTEEREAAAAAERNKGSEIEIDKDSPADTVRVFYSRLRENKFRDAISLTNLRPAIEGLTDAEMKDLGVDFGYLAKNVPDVVPINGEIITGNEASVTVKLPNDETRVVETQEIRLRKQDSSWVVLLADNNAEKLAQKERSNYFFALRMDVHHKEAKAMLDRIGKAQLIYSAGNGGRFGSLESLIEKGYLPQDAANAQSTGYSFDIKLASDASTYTALATPAIYGKSGKLSYALKITKTTDPKLVSLDAAGRPLA